MGRRSRKSTSNISLDRALLEACKSKKWGIAKTLLEHGATIGVEDRYTGLNAHLYACIYDHNETLKVMDDRCSDGIKLYNEKTLKGYKSRESALAKKLVAFQSETWYQEWMKRMSTKKDRQRLLDIWLWNACKIKSWDFAMTALEMGADMDYTDKFGFSAIHKAAML